MFHEFSFSSFPHLAYLNLSFNVLFGINPPSLVTSPSLTVHDSNTLFGIISPQISNISNLKFLDLGNNQLSGVILPEIGLLTHLKHLYIDVNKLRGSVPREGGQLSSLKQLVLCCNGLSGWIPSSFDLSENQLSGLIPQFLGNLSNLVVLHLGGNSLFGYIPPILRKVQSLLSLGFDLNRLGGVLPPSISNPSNLEGLYLYFNRLSGSVPTKIGNLMQLIELEIDNNQLFGQIPRSLRNFTSLNIVHLERNHLTGNIPEVFGIYPNLTFLDLGQNNFYGSLNFSMNNITRSIPPKIGKLYQLYKLDFSLNHIVGEIPIELGNLKSLNYRGLNGDKVYGSLPRVLGSLIELEKLVKLTELDLSHNFLGGEIYRPKSLLGLIPNNTGIHYNPVDALQESKGLCGKIMYEEVIRATNNFDAKYCINTGGHASVYKAEQPSWEIVAVKKFHLPHPDMVVQQAFLNEIKASTELRHRNIVKFYVFCFHPRQSFLLYEYLERGSLATILSNDAAIEEFSWTVRMNVIKSVANALSYMHHDYFPPIVHRDISSKNSLLTQ
ncbi:hypothetical protein CUMW_242230 [Citrus unshiu]|uniref:non-specific serine/threonine protein kinase n=1 Tax=Citrus unshiu TaxID=55188 RepID=A0A2H5QMU6_CITUN|nr:hypothetical protein CUMW_242230 [Citrus unshiu]